MSSLRRPGSRLSGAVDRSRGGVADRSQRDRTTGRAAPSARGHSNSQRQQQQQQQGDDSDSDMGSGNKENKSELGMSGSAAAGSAMTGTAAANSNAPTILFDTSKGELCSPTEGFQN